MTDRYQVKGNIVFDTQTGLEWQAKHTEPMTWTHAMKYATELGGGWRLPTIAELLSLVDYTRIDPASTFPGIPSGWFWTSSSDAGGSSHAWYVSFSLGGVSNNGKTSYNYVRCVRGVADATVRRLTEARNAAIVEIGTWSKQAGRLQAEVQRLTEERDEARRQIVTADYEGLHRGHENIREFYLRRAKVCYYWGAAEADRLFPPEKKKDT